MGKLRISVRFTIIQAGETTQDWPYLYAFCNLTRKSKEGKQKKNIKILEGGNLVSVKPEVYQPKYKDKTL